MVDAIVKTSKFLSLVLRHRPEMLGMQLDPEGWLPIDELITNANRRGRALTRELLDEVVARNDKQRFAISEDGMRIRASQGHSVRAVDLHLPPAEPPERLYHGTVDRFLDGIRREGLRRRTRQHVHLSPDVETARTVGSRRGAPIVLAVAAGRMARDGHVFWLSANGVWLTDSVPVEYLSLPE